MKILHFSDVHGDIEQLRHIREYAQKQSGIELAVCTGDILGNCLTQEQAMLNQVSYGYIQNAIKTQEPIPFSSIIEFCLKQERGTNIRKAGEDYSETQEIFDKNAEINYSQILKEILQFPQKVLVIPGNWDSAKSFPEFFGDFDIDGKTKQVGDIKFSGYGSSRDLPVFLPPTRIIPFNERQMYEFLTREDPDFVLTHVPPHGIQDITNDKQKIGNFASLAYLRGECPEILFCGHCHESPGIVKENQTLVVNSGNLGKYGNSSGGLFAEIEKTGDEISAKIKSLRQIL